MSVDEIPLPSTSGRLHLCALRDIASDPEAVLVATRSTTVVCLNERTELERRAPHYAEWLRVHQPESALWFPIRNFRAESADATMPLLDLVVERLARGEGVVMHCAMGQGRAGTIGACLLMRLGASADDALRTIAAHRAFAGPADASQWALIDDVERALHVGNRRRPTGD